MLHALFLASNLFSIDMVKYFTPYNRWLVRTLLPVSCRSVRECRFPVPHHAFQRVLTAAPSRNKSLGKRTTNYLETVAVGK